MTLMAPAMAADGALVLGFERHGNSIQRRSISALDQSPAPATIAATSNWRVVAEDGQGRALWQWPVVAPQRFHPAADGRSEFVLVIPAVAPGTQLRLEDQGTRVLWSERIGAAQLAQARQRGQQSRARLLESGRSTRDLLSREPDASLGKHLAAIANDRRTAGLAAGRMQPLVEPVLPVDGASITAPRPVQEPLRPGDRPRAQESIDPDAALLAQPSKAISGGVLVTVVDDQGQPPTAGFPANLFEDGQWIGQFMFDAQGHASLPLTSGMSYELDFLPRAPLVAERMAFDYAGVALPPFVLRAGWLLDVILHDQADQPIAGPHSGLLYAQIGDQFRFFPLNLDEAEPGRLRYAVPKIGGISYGLDSDPAGEEHVQISVKVGSIAGDYSRVVRVASAELLPGQVQALDGGPSANAGSMHCSGYLGGIFYSSTTTILADSSFALRVPLEMSAYCAVFPPAPLLYTSFTRTFHAGDSIAVSLLRGAPVRFLVQDPLGQPIADGFRGDWNAEPSQTGFGCHQSPCDLLIPTDREVAVSFRFDSGEYAAIELAPRQYVADSEHLVVATPLRHANGQVLGGDPIYQGQTRVRVYDAQDRFVVSSLGTQFDFGLRDGSYRFVADGNLPLPPPGSPWFFRRTVDSGPIAISNDTTVPDLALPTARGVVRVIVERPCGFDDHSVRVVMNALDGRRLDRMHFETEPAPTRPPGQCASVHELGLSPGNYAIDIAPLGWLPQHISTSVVDAQTQQQTLTFTAANRTQVWRGRFVDALNQPLSWVGVFIDDQEQMAAANASVDQQGNFEMPFVPGWGVKAWVSDPDLQRAVGAAIKFGNTPPGPIWRLDRVDLPALQDQGLIRIYGNGDRVHRRNIVFVADGYTDVHETYTDSNGNGRWDGTVWHDLNHNGVLDYSGDHFWIYGSGPVPIDGQVPISEPFVDLNGDGALSEDDPALFVENVRAFMRSLLSSDVWSEHRDSFNAWLMFAPSAQAGYDVLSVDNDVLLERNTRYGAALSLNGAMLQVDTTAMLEDAIAALPEVDVMVAMLNETLPGGRANASYGEPGFIIFSGGVLNNDSNQTAQSHEMAHFVGKLCDEYTEFNGFHRLTGSLESDLNCANASVRVDPARVPWAELLPSPTGAWPTLDRDGGLGLFEGAGYMTNGAYRPTMDSTMRMVKPFFNQPSRIALEQAIAAHAAAAEVLFRSSFE